MRIRLRWPIAAVLLLVVGWGAYAAWTAKQVADELNAASDAASGLKDAVTAGNDKATDRSLASLQGHAQTAVDKTDSLTWTMLTKVPFVGDDAEGVQVVSEVVKDVATAEVTDLLGDDGALSKLTPTNSEIDLDAVESLRDPVAYADGILADAVAKLDTQDPDGFIGPLGEKFTELQDQVVEAADAISSADTAMDVLPQMLGSDGERTYLLVMQNNAELRATGGLPGAVAVVTADDGKIAMTRQTAGSAIPEADAPVLPLSASEKKLYGEQLGTYFVDANFTPDFPRVADLMRAHWVQAFPEQPDGVLMVDTVTLSYLLRATGPITVDGVELNADNAVDELLNGVYLRLTDPAAMDAFFQATARTVFDTIASGNVDTQELLKAFAKAADERRIFIHNFDDVQEPLLGTPVAGDVLTGPGSEDNMVVTLNDTTGSKMSYYLDYDLTACTAQDGTTRSTLTITSNAPKDAADLPAYITGGGVYGIDPGDELLTIRVYPPTGSEITDFKVDDRKNPPILVKDGDSDRASAMTYAFMEPGMEVDMTWSTAGAFRRDLSAFATPDVRGGISVTKVGVCE